MIFSFLLRRCHASKNRDSAWRRVFGKYSLCFPLNFVCEPVTLVV